MLRLLLIALLAACCEQALAQAEDRLSANRSSGSPTECTTSPDAEQGQEAQQRCEQTVSAEQGEQPGGSNQQSKNDAEQADQLTASAAVSEDVQDAAMLRHLLHGRQLIFFGRLEPELAMYHVPALKGDSGPELRRFRVGIAGVNPWWEDVSYKLELDLTDGTSTLSSAYLHWAWSASSALTVGYQDVVQNLSAETGSLSQLFMEAPLPVDTFSLSKRLAVSYDWDGLRSGLHAMVFGRDPNDSNDSRGLAARVYFNPHRSGDGIFHVGAALVLEQVDESVRLRNRPESHDTDVRLVDTGSFDDIDHQEHFSLEIAGAKRAFTGRMEFFTTQWKRTNGSDNSFYGAYWEGGYFLTGQAFNYSHGKFVRPKLTQGTTAWELGLRLSWVDLNDGSIVGGEERNAGVAVNYYPRPNIRGQFNLIQVNADQAGGDGYLMQWRLQWNW
jgi:phosphate-selective porin OprO/OprP